MRNTGPVLVVGATGFVGGRVVAALLEDGRDVRALVRTPGRATDLPGRVQIVPGDMLDPAAVTRATESVSAVVVCVHTVSRQRHATRDQDFIDVEEAGIRTVVDACRVHDVRRVVYVTSIGVDPDAGSTWLRGRARTEQLLLDSGLDATVIRPGMVVGRGGDGFGIVERGARSRVALVLADRRQRFRTVAVDDLAGQLVALLDEPRAVGRAFDVGSDDVLTMDGMIDVAAEHLGRPRPRKLHLPRPVVARLAPLFERLARLPRGALGGLFGEGSATDLVGDVGPVRELLPRPPRSYRQTLEDTVAR